MYKKINSLVGIIGDYRVEDIGPNYNTRIDYGHINNWLNQFDEQDREFLVDELLHLLPKSYLTKMNIFEKIITVFEVISKDYGYDNINKFFDETRFLDCQSEGKSQKFFLDFINYILIQRYDRSISNCGISNVKNWFYIDDVLASGGTFRKEILSAIETYGTERFKESNINIISSFVILHNWARINVPSAIDKTLQTRLGNRLQFYTVPTDVIENNPIFFIGSKPQKFNHVYPIRTDVGNQVLDFVQEKLSGEYEFRNERYAFRDSPYPIQETFFSSPKNRIRYENILLDKGFEIMKSIVNLNARSLRPLGVTNPSNKTLGTGTHFFTWRNISNTCPIVFWWDANGWTPLFPRLRGNY